MTNGAVLKARGSQIVKRRRNSPYFSVRRGSRQVRVAFQAHQALLVTHQHSGVRRSVRLMACAAAFQPHGRVLEHKWAAFIAVTAQASWLIAERNSHTIGPEAGVWIVAIHARHGSLRQPMFVRPVERGPLGDVAGGTTGIDLRILAFHQFGGAGPVN